MSDGEFLGKRISCETVFQFYEGDEDVSGVTHYNSEGKCEGPGDLPAQYSLTKDGIVTYALWSKDDLEHRDHGRPSTIMVDPETGKVNVLIFMKHGCYDDSTCGHYHISIHPDGTMEDEDGEPIKVDLSKIPIDFDNPIPVPQMGLMPKPKPP